MRFEKKGRPFPLKLGGKKKKKSLPEVRKQDRFLRLYRTFYCRAALTSDLSVRDHNSQQKESHLLRNSFQCYSISPLKLQATVESFVKLCGSYANCCRDVKGNNAKVVLTQEYDKHAEQVSRTAHTVVTLSFSVANIMKYYSEYWLKNYTVHRLCRPWRK